MTIVRFTSTTCVPCKRQGKLIAELKERGDIKVDIQSVDVEQEPEFARRCHVRSVPTLVKLEDDQPVASLNGAVPEDQLMAFLNED